MKSPLNAIPYYIKNQTAGYAQIITAPSLSTVWISINIEKWT